MKEVKGTLWELSESDLAKAYYRKGVALTWCTEWDLADGELAKVGVQQSCSRALFECSNHAVMLCAVHQSCCVQVHQACSVCGHIFHAPCENRLQVFGCL